MSLMKAAVLYQAGGPEQPKWEPVPILPSAPTDL